MHDFEWTAILQIDSYQALLSFSVGDWRLVNRLHKHLARLSTLGLSTPRSNGRNVTDPLVGIDGIEM